MFVLWAKLLFFIRQRTGMTVLLLLSLLLLLLVLLLLIVCFCTSSGRVYSWWGGVRGNRQRENGSHALVTWPNSAVKCTGALQCFENKKANACFCRKTGLVKSFSGRMTARAGVKGSTSGHTQPSSSLLSTQGPHLMPASQTVKQPHCMLL